MIGTKIVRLLIRMMGWRTEVSVPDYQRAIIIVAPHTSNWDFIIGKLALASVGRRADFLMKSTWFFWPLGPIFRAMGGIPVYRDGSHGSLTQQIIERFGENRPMVLAITPEGTRSPVAKWRSGFWQVARATGVPVLLATLDFRKKLATLTAELPVTDSLDADMRALKNYYVGITPRHPANFIVD